MLLFVVYDFMENNEQTDNTERFHVNLSWSDSWTDRMKA